MQILFGHGKLGVRFNTLLGKVTDFKSSPMILLASSLLWVFFFRYLGLFKLGITWTNFGTKEIKPENQQCDVILQLFQYRIILKRILHQILIGIVFMMILDLWIIQALSKRLAPGVREVILPELFGRGWLTRALWERLDPGVRRTRAQKRVPSFVSCPTNLFK